MTTEEQKPCTACGHSRKDHMRWTEPEQIAKYGLDLCYGMGDGGCPGPDCGRPTCPCREFKEAVR